MSELFYRTYKDLFICILVCGCFGCMYMYNTCRGQKRTSDSWELALKTVMSHHESVRNQTNPGPLEEQRLLLTNCWPSLRISNGCFWFYLVLFLITFIVTLVFLPLVCIFIFLMLDFGQNEMAYWVKALAAKPHKLSLNDPWTHTIKYQELSCKLSSSLHTSAVVHAHARTEINQYGINQ